MQLSSVREGLPFELVSRHVKSHQDEEREYDDLTRPEQLNVQADHRATEHSMNFVQTIPSQSSILPAKLPCDSTGYLTSHEIRTLRTEFTGTSSERTFRDATTGQTRYMIPSVGLLTDPMPDSLTISGHSWSSWSWWLPIGVRERLCSGTTDTCPQ
jgi:hypothetical protein